MTKTPTKPRRRFLRISLRTFLLLITVGCVWLGWKVNKAQKQRAAVNTITNLGGSVYYDYQILKEGTKLTIPGGTSIGKDGSTMTWGAATIVVGNERHSYLYSKLTTSTPPVPAWMRKLVGDEMFVNVVAVDLENTALSNSEVQCLSGLPNLRLLKLSGTKITDQALIHFADLQKLEELELDGTLVEGPGLVHLRHLTHLEELSLTDTRITDEGLLHVAAPKNLTSIKLDNTDLSDAGLEYLRSSNQLTVVSLSHTKVRGPGLLNLSGAYVEALRLAYTPIEEEGLSCLANWPKLRVLSLEHSSLTDRGVEQLKQVTQLETLRLPWVAHRSSNISVEAARGIEKALVNTEVVYPP